MNKEYKDDLIEFAESNKFQWFAIIIVMLIALRCADMLPIDDFVSLLRFAIISVFGAEGLDQLTNVRKF